MADPGVPCHPLSLDHRHIHILTLTPVREHGKVQVVQARMVQEQVEMRDQTGDKWNRGICITPSPSLLSGWDKGKGACCSRMAVRAGLQSTARDKGRVSRALGLSTPWPHRKAEYLVRVPLLA